MEKRIKEVITNVYSENKIVGKKSSWYPQIKDLEPFCYVMGISYVGGDDIPWMTFGKSLLSGATLPFDTYEEAKKILDNIESYLYYDPPPEIKYHKID